MSISASALAPTSPMLLPPRLRCLMLVPAAGVGKREEGGGVAAARRREAKLSPPGAPDRPPAIRPNPPCAHHVPRAAHVESRPDSLLPPPGRPKPPSHPPSQPSTHLEVEDGELVILDLEQLARVNGCTRAGAERGGRQRARRLVGRAEQASVAEEEGGKVDSSFWLGPGRG